MTGKITPGFAVAESDKGDNKQDTTRCALGDQ